jgi:hypothetical protein
MVSYYGLGSSILRQGWPAGDSIPLAFSLLGSLVQRPSSSIQLWTSSSIIDLPAFLRLSISVVPNFDNVVGPLRHWKRNITCTDTPWLPLFRNMVPILPDTIFINPHFSIELLLTQLRFLLDTHSTKSAASPEQYQASRHNTRDQGLTL